MAGSSSGVSGRHAVVRARSCEAPRVPRLRIDVERAGGAVRSVIVIAGPRVRFGRNAGRENELVLRAFPRSPLPDETVERRALAVSRRHGTFCFFAGGFFVRDDGSALGIALDGRVLEPHEDVPLPDAFALEVPPRGIVLLGTVARRRDGERALRLVRACGDEHLVYVLLSGDEGSAGSGPADSVLLPFAGIRAGHVRLVLRRGLVGVSLGEALLPIRPGGRRIVVGDVRLSIAEAMDDDMKPARCGVLDVPPQGTALDSQGGAASGRRDVRRSAECGVDPDRKALEVGGAGVPPRPVSVGGRDARPTDEMTPGSEPDRRKLDLRETTSWDLDGLRR